MFIVKFDERDVVLLQDEREVTRQRTGHPSDVQLGLAGVDVVVEALRTALHEVVRQSARYHTQRAALDLTDGFHR